MRCFSGEDNARPECSTRHVRLCASLIIVNVIISLLNIHDCCSCVAGIRRGSICSDVQILPNFVRFVVFCGELAGLQAMRLQALLSPRRSTGLAIIHGDILCPEYANQLMPRGMNKP